MLKGYLDGRCLQRPPVAEGEGPGLLGDRSSVDGVQVDGGLLFALPPGQETNPRHGGGNRAGEGEYCGLWDGGEIDLTL